MWWELREPNDSFQLAVASLSLSFMQQQQVNIDLSRISLVLAHETLQHVSPATFAFICLPKLLYQSWDEQKKNNMHIYIYKN